MLLFVNVVSMFSELLFLAEWWAGADVQLYTEKENFGKYYGKEHSYLIMNHRFETDWLMGWLFCERVGVLGASIFRTRKFGIFYFLRIVF